ncbi:hypothetical protein IJ541_01925 [bacterium]|nr:hypothetical protein [bacterium]
MIKTVVDNNLLNDLNRDYNYMTWFSNISSCLMKGKIENIFKQVLSEQNSNKCIILFREKLSDISNYRISDINAYTDMIRVYANTWCGTPEIANNFMSAFSDNEFYKYFKVKYIGRKRIRGQEGYKIPNNIIFDFNFDNFIALTGIIEDMFKYETCFRHYFMLIYILDIMQNAGIKLSDYIYSKLFPVLFNNINSTVLTGMKAFAEFDLGYPYVLLYDELQHLTPETKRKFSYSTTPDNLSITFKIKEYSIVTKKFAKYLGNALTDEDIGRVIICPKGLYRIKYSDVIHLFKDKDLDTQAYSELRIIQGSTTNNMKVLIRLSGQRIINRLFSINGNVHRNIKTHKLYKYIYMSDNFVAFTLWIFLNSTAESKNNFKNVKPSTLLPYILFIQKYVEQKQKEISKRGSKNTPRDIIPNTATVIMLSKLPKTEQEAFINNSFKYTDTQQKTFIRQGIAKIKNLQSRIRIKTSLVAKLVKELEYVYKW